MSKPLIKTTPRAHRMTYRIGRGEQGVLTFEPYKSHLLPLWRFRTVSVAQKSAQDLWDKFEEFDSQDDFVGMDMTRKFIQMGYTRARRYANHKGGRKYKKAGEEEGKKYKKGGEEEGKKREELPRRADDEGRREKEGAAEVFKGYWERCKEHEGYQLKKEIWQEELKDWLKANPPEEG